MIRRPRRYSHSIHKLATYRRMLGILFHISEDVASHHVADGKARFWSIRIIRRPQRGNPQAASSDTPAADRPNALEINQIKSMRKLSRKFGKKLLGRRQSRNRGVLFHRQPALLAAGA